MKIRGLVALSALYPLKPSLGDHNKKLELADASNRTSQPIQTAPAFPVAAPTSSPLPSPTLRSSASLSASPPNAPNRTFSRCIPAFRSFPFTVFTSKTSKPLIVLTDLSPSSLFPLQHPTGAKKSLLVLLSNCSCNSSKGFQEETPRLQSIWTLTPASRSPSVSSRPRTGVTLHQKKQKQR